MDAGESGATLAAGDVNGDGSADVAMDTLSENQVTACGGAGHERESVRIFCRVMSTHRADGFPLEIG